GKAPGCPDRCITSPRAKTAHFFERQNLPLRVSALFSEFFISFSTATPKKRGLPLMIFANHFETAPFDVFIFARLL
ncbi:MAG: hypothetical protein PUH34_02355, partial [Eubacteriales bacterium]|nr:hypothetical protein [Eubacteriales bacterium]